MSSSENGSPIRPALGRKQWFDDVIEEVDVALRVLSGVAQASRPSPARLLPRDNPTEMDPKCAAHSAGLMRINQVGEVCAQALYRAQALVCKDENAQELFRRAATEEVDHLVWCNERLAELKSRPSLLNPAWYLGSFALGIVAAKAGVALNLGFMAETERQVEAHLDDHLRRLPQSDGRSRAIVTQMKGDEAGHRIIAEQNGAAVLPGAIKVAMGALSKCMTTVAYRI